MATTSISITPQFGNNSVVAINCGTSSPRLSGTIDISAFPSLTSFICNSNDITALSGYANNSNIKDLRFNDNKITGTLPSLSSLTNLETFWFNNNLLSGQLPNLSGLNKLTSFIGFVNYFTGPIPVLTGCPLLVDFCVSTQLGSVGNRLTGQIPSLSGLTFLQNFSVAQNDLSGPVPNLDSCSSLEIFNIQQNTDITGPLPSLTATKNSLYFFNIWLCSCTGPLPSLSGFNALDEFVAAENRFTGSIPAFGVLPRLRVYNVGFQRTAPTLQGSIPSLSGLSTLQIFYCATNQLTGFDGGSVSNTLGNFQAQNNQLSATAVNAILSAFVAANKTSGTRILNLGGTGNAAPSYTGGVTTTSSGSNFTRSGTTVTANVTNHGHTNGDIVTITGLSPTAFQGTFVVTVNNLNQFQYTTISSGAATGSGTATMRRTTNSSDGYASYQNLALVSRPGGPWDITINQP